VSWPASYHATQDHCEGGVCRARREIGGDGCLRYARDVPYRARARPTGPWGAFPIEKLEQNVASKMVALVHRGAPRDFVNIKRVVDSGVFTVQRCWELWTAKSPDTAAFHARLLVKIRLKTIELRMPLDSLPAEHRSEAAGLRAWYRDVFTADARRLAHAEDGADGRAKIVIDHSVYPDIEHGNSFEDDFDRADYVHRICAAADFGVPPDPETIELFSEWREVLDRFPLPASPTYHALREYYDWPATAMLRNLHPTQWETLDRIDGRDDPCRGLV
jgi:hypothetical protein